MEQLPVTGILIDFLQSGDSSKFFPALRLVANIAACNKSDYIDHFYKSGMLGALVIGWRNVSPNPDVDKEASWMLSNMVACNSEHITKAIVGSPFILDKMRCILTLGTNST